MKPSLWDPRVRVDVSTREQRPWSWGVARGAQAGRCPALYAAFPDSPGGARICALEKTHAASCQWLWRFLSLFKISVLNWGIIALQSCVGFCRRSAWISLSRGVPLSLSALPPRPNLLPCSRSQSAELSLSLGSFASWLCAHVVRAVLRCYPSTHPAPLLPLHKAQSPILRACISTCPEKRLICTIFLDSICVCYYTVFVFLSLTYCALYDVASRFIHSQFNHWFIWVALRRKPDDVRFCARRRSLPVSCALVWWNLWGGLHGRFSPRTSLVKEPGNTLDWNSRLINKRHLWW